ncbi:hypothetical protein [Cetobacterium sp.]|uniref:hypothetical protein n=1 Tax=Cetobacterium sp. TaxID=2071632 RepID=UPI003F406966
MEHTLKIIIKNPVLKYAPILILGIIITLFLMGYVMRKMMKRDNEKDYANLIDFIRIFYFVCASTYFFLVKQYYMILVFFGTDMITNLILKKMQNKRMDMLREERNFWSNLKVEEAIEELRNMKE